MSNPGVWRFAAAPGQGTRIGKVRVFGLGCFDLIRVRGRVRGRVRLGNERASGEYGVAIRFIFGLGFDYGISVITV